jgi:hypothetical protein
MKCGLHGSPALELNSYPATIAVDHDSCSSGALGELKIAVRALGNRAVAHRTTVGTALAGWRDELIGGLGGDDKSLSVITLKLRRRPRSSP